MKKEVTDKLLSLVQEGYNQIASEFDLTRKKKLWPELEKLAAVVKDGDSVLDAGCGNGRLLEAFVDKKINYFGFDNSSSLLEIAKQNYPEYKFIFGDVLKKDEALVGKFNYVFCVAVIAHIPSRKLQQQALENLSSYLGSGGQLIISVWNLRQKLNFKLMILKNLVLKFFGLRALPSADLVFPWQDKAGAQRYYHAFSKRELERLVKKAGFKIAESYRDNYNYWLILK